MAPDPKRRRLIISALACAATTLTGCLSSAPRAVRPEGERSIRIGARRASLVEIASAQIGAPYRHGGNRPSGFDCSGLVQFAHARAGVKVPRTAAEQWRTAARLNRSHLLPGDLLFFDLGARKPSHVGIYEGRGHFIHAPSSGKRVSRTSLDNPYWHARWLDSRTFL